MSNDDDTAAMRARGREIDSKWHGSINRFHDGKTGDEYRHWMYEAKRARAEVPRIARLFQIERAGGLRKVHRQCSQSEAMPVTDNHLTCCLGVECRKCPELSAIAPDGLTAEEIDELKAWTCVTHIVSTGGDKAMEGYVLTTDDQMFWRGVYGSLASGGSHE